MTCMTWSCSAAAIAPLRSYHLRATRKRIHLGSSLRLAVGWVWEVYHIPEIQKCFFWVSPSRTGSVSLNFMNIETDFYLHLLTEKISDLDRPSLPSALCLGARMTDAVEWATMKASQGIISGEINQHWLFCIPIQVGPATDHARNLRHWFALIIAPWKKCG